VAGWLPAVLGIVGTLILFYGCLLLIRETRLAIQAVTLELEFAQTLRILYEKRGKFSS
jgi:hypothetical protein